MSLKSLTTILALLALIAVCVFGVVYFNSKSDIAAAEAAKAQSAAVEAEALSAKAKAEASQESSKSVTEKASAARAEAEAKKAAADAEKAKTDLEIASEAAKRAEAEKLKALAEAEKAKALAEEAAAKRVIAKAEQEKAKADAAKAKADAEAEASKALATQAELDKVKIASEKVLAEKALLDARISDIEDMERELLDFKRTLDERERALKPELTVRDIASADKAPEAGAIGAKLLDENDLSLPRESRTLAKAKRISLEAEAELLASMRTNTVQRLEKLYVTALVEDRVVDAEFYKNQIKVMYPDWKFTKKEKEEK